MTGDREEPERNPRQDATGCVTFLVVAALAGAAFLAGARFLLRVLDSGGG